MISNKISQRLMSTLYGMRASSAEDLTLLVWSTSPIPTDRLPKSEEEAFSALEAAGFKRSFFDAYGLRIGRVITLAGAFSVKAPVDRSLRLAKDASDLREIMFLDVPGTFEATLDVTVPMIGVDSVWRDFGYTGRGIKVAIVDSGIDENHPDFKGRVIERANFSSDPDFKDYDGHGSHVAGIVAGAGEKYRGVAPEALLINAKALDRKGVGSEEDVAYAIEWSYRAGAHVINLSLGGEDLLNCRDTTAKTAEEVAKRGVVVVAAAGNSGEFGRGTIKTPGCSPLVITVGAVTKSGALASYSSRGPTSSGIEKPDLLAPGGDKTAPVIAPLSQTILPENLKKLKPFIVDELYVGLSGTSMATPHVAGVAALLLEEAGKLGLLESESNPHFLVKHVVTSTAKDLGYERNEQGAGLVNSAAAVQYLEKLYEARKSVLGRVVAVPTLPPGKEAPAKPALEQLSRELVTELFRTLGFAISSSIIQGLQVRQFEDWEREARDLLEQLRTLETLHNLGLIPEPEYLVRRVDVMSRLDKLLRKLQNSRNR